MGQPGVDQHPRSAFSERLTPIVASCVASLLSDQPVNATPCVSGRAHATATIRSRWQGVALLRRPPR
jgi:hypothetical protein